MGWSSSVTWSVTTRNSSENIEYSGTSRHQKILNILNLLWVRKVLEVFKYSDHFSGTEYAGNSLYILNIFIFHSVIEILSLQH